MKRNTYLLITSLFIAACSQSPPTIGELQFAEGSDQHVVLAHEIQWKPCPPHLPSGCEITVLEGSPKEADLFTTRFRLNADFKMPAHTHPKDERVTILSGNAYVAFGDDRTKDKAKVFGPGDYYVNRRDAVHTVWIDSGSILQITGIGPWEVNYIDE